MAVTLVSDFGSTRFARKAIRCADRNPLDAEAGKIEQNGRRPAAESAQHRRPAPTLNAMLAGRGNKQDQKSLIAKDLRFCLTGQKSSFSRPERPIFDSRAKRA